MDVGPLHVGHHWIASESDTRKYRSKAPCQRKAGSPGAVFYEALEHLLGAAEPFVRVVVRELADDLREVLVWEPAEMNDDGFEKIPVRIARGEGEVGEEEFAGFAADFSHGVKFLLLQYRRVYAFGTCDGALLAIPAILKREPRLSIR